jgi:hypothetical protein
MDVFGLNDDFPLVVRKAVVHSVVVHGGVGVVIDVNYICSRVFGPSAVFLARSFIYILKGIIYAENKL